MKRVYEQRGRFAFVRCLLRFSAFERNLHPRTDAIKKKKKKKKRKRKHRINKHIESTRHCETNQNGKLQATTNGLGVL
jgi:hypothetical protein